MWSLLATGKANTRAPLGTFSYTNVGYNIATILTDRKLGVRWQELLEQEYSGPFAPGQGEAVRFEMGDGPQPAALVFGGIRFVRR